jgi:hypothetical protein
LAAWRTDPAAPWPLAGPCPWQPAARDRPIARGLRVVWRSSQGGQQQHPCSLRSSRWRLMDLLVCTGRVEAMNCAAVHRPQWLRGRPSVRPAKQTTSVNRISDHSVELSAPAAPFERKGHPPAPAPGGSWRRFDH